MAFFALQDLRLLCKVSVWITARVIICSDIEILVFHSHNIRNTCSTIEEPIFLSSSNMRFVSFCTNFSGPKTLEKSKLSD